MDFGPKLKFFHEMGVFAYLRPLTEVAENEAEEE
jgi:hypothetical protein